MRNRWSQSKTSSAAKDRVAGKTVPATLVKTIDAQTAKVGDEVLVRTTEALNGPRLVPKGATLIGHIVEVKVRSDDQPTSQVVIAFDNATAQAGKSTQVSASIASIARPQNSSAPSEGSTGDLGIPSTGSSSGVPREGRSAGGSMGPPPDAHAGKDGQTRAAGDFTLRQRPDGSVISSNSQNVRLESGTQLLLKVQPN
jgi:hypothetical protein